MNVALLLTLSVVSATVHVDDYLDPNEAYQHAAIRRAAAAAGVDGEVLFTAGKTYTLRGEVGQYEGQVWRTDGAELATLRRANEVTTTLLEDAPAGATSIRVTDPSVFEELDFASPVFGDAGQDEGQQAVTRILTIEGDTLHLHRELQQDYSAGDTVVNTVRMVRMAERGTLESIRIDGNAENNDTFVSWIIHTDVTMPRQANYSTVRNVEFVNAQGNALLASGDDQIVQDSTFRGSNLAAVHLSSTTNLQWIDNHIEQTNLQASRGGHSEGAITISLANFNVLIQGGSIQDVPIYAIATSKAGHNSDFHITGVTFENNLGVWYSLAKDTGPDVGLVFEHNMIINSGELTFQGKVDTWLERILLNDNTFENSGISLQYVEGMLLFRNDFDEDSWQNIEFTTFGRFSPADLDNDGDIDTIDITKFFQNFTGDIGEEGEKTFLQGDTDGDGDVDTLDLTKAFQRFTGDLGGEPQPYDLPEDDAPATTSAVPEPNTLLLLATAALVLLAVFARRRLLRLRVTR